MKKALSDFLTFGIVKIVDTPVVETFAYQVAGVREIVVDRVALRLLSSKKHTRRFTSAALPLHRLLRLQMATKRFLFHCLENDVIGGESEYSDRLHASEVMLFEIPVVFQDVIQ